MSYHLTEDDVRVLRNATEVRVAYNALDGSSVLVARKILKDRVYGETVAEREMPCGILLNGILRDDVKFAGITFNRTDRLWQSFIQGVKPNDTITAIFNHAPDVDSFEFLRGRPDGRGGRQTVREAYTLMAYQRVTPEAYRWIEV